VLFALVQGRLLGLSQTLIEIGVELNGHHRAEA
jgi:hypothetical protein